MPTVLDLQIAEIEERLNRHPAINQDAADAYIEDGPQHESPIEVREAIVTPFAGVFEALIQDRPSGWHGAVGLCVMAMIDTAYVAGTMKTDAGRGTR